MSTRSTPHVTIDARMAGDGGIGTYIRGVVPEIVKRRREWRFALLTGSEPDAAGQSWIEASNVERVRCAAPIYSLREQWVVPKATSRDTSLFWSPHYNIPLGVRAPLVVTVHDVAHLARPEYRSSLARRAYSSMMFAAVRRRARAIIFDSAFTEREFERYVGAPRDATVVHLGVDDEWRELSSAPPHTSSVAGEHFEAASPKRQYVICIGYRKPHKNLVGLVRAFRSVAAAVPHDLVIVGRDEGLRTGDDEVVDAARSLGDRVIFTGEVSADELRRWVAGAELLVQPSFYEGFGLPPLEAMAAGCPCVVAQAGSLPEVCGDAAVYCDPLDVASIADAILSVLRDAALRETLIARGRANAARFTWETCAEQTLAVLDRAMTAPGGSISVERR